MQNGPAVANKYLRGRIHDSNEVLAGVGGNEQLANVMKHYSPSYMTASLKKAPLSPSLLDGPVAAVGGGG